MSDYIRRDDAIRRLRILAHEWFEEDVVKLGLACEPIDTIRAIPSADVVERKDYESMERTVRKLTDAIAETERKKGEWIEITIKDYKAKCSACGTWSPIMGNFCPNCGSGMRGDDDES